MMKAKRSQNGSCASGLKINQSRREKEGGGLWDDGHHENSNTIVTGDDDTLENTIGVFITAPVKHRDKTKDRHQINNNEF